MKLALPIILLILISGCKNIKAPSSDAGESITVSFINGTSNSSSGIAVAYTEDSDSLWMDVRWVNFVKLKMRKLALSYPTVILFDGEDNMPDVGIYGIEYDSKYDQHMVCGYWKYSNGNTKFCYGGVKADGNFNVCK
jgi:hypothetical protein